MCLLADGTSTAKIATSLKRSADVPDENGREHRRNNESSSHRIVLYAQSLFRCMADGKRRCRRTSKWFCVGQKACPLNGAIPLPYSPRQKLNSDSGLHFYLTKDPNQLPEYGPHVVAVLLQEERCKIPAYALHVRAVVRNLHSTPFLGFRQLRLNRLNAVLAFEYVRDWALHHRSRQALRSPHPDWSQQLHTTPRIYTIPLGYHSQDELPQIPMQDRTLDSFFAGELATILPPTTYRYCFDFESRGPQALGYNK